MRRSSQLLVRQLRTVANFEEAIGNTPLIRLRAASELTGCEIFGKAEFLNPGGSVKDRAALGIIVAAERSGMLKPGGTIVEGTAGNTGIGLTAVANARGYHTVIVIPETQTPEKKEALRTLGARLVEVPARPYKHPDNYVRLSGRLAERLGAVWANQFDKCVRHYRTIATPTKLAPRGAPRRVAALPMPLTAKRPIHRLPPAAAWPIVIFTSRPRAQKSGSRLVVARSMPSPALWAPVARLLGAPSSCAKRAKGGSRLASPTRRAQVKASHEEEKRPPSLALPCLLSVARACAREAALVHLLALTISLDAILPVLAWIYRCSL